jgi:SNF2 family DNA or RNA helicase
MDAIEKKYESKIRFLTENEREILYYFSLFYEPVTAQEFQRFLTAFKFRRPQGGGVTAQYASVLRNSFIKKGLLANVKGRWGNGVWIKDKAFREFLTRELRKEDRFDEAVGIIRQEFGVESLRGWYSDVERRDLRCLRDFRLSIYQKNTKDADETLNEINDPQVAARSGGIVSDIFSNPFQKDFLEEFATDFQAPVLLTLLDEKFKRMEATDELWDFVDEHDLTDGTVLRIFRLEQMLFEGRLGEAEKLLTNPKTLGEIGLAGVAAFLKTDYRKSVKLFEEQIKVWKSVFRKRKGFPDLWMMFFYGLALYKTDEAKFHRFAAEYSEFGLKNHSDPLIFRSLDAVSHYLKNKDDLARMAVSQIGSDDFYERFLKIILAAVIPSVKKPDFVGKFGQTAGELGYRWAELETANLLEENSSGQAERAEKLAAELGFEPVGNLIPSFEEWERAVKTLELIAEKNGAKKQTKAALNETRVAWQLDFFHREVQPVEQKFGKSGWTKGRNIALKRLYENDVANLTEQDRRTVANAMKRYSSYYYGGYDFEFLWEKAIENLVGHPYLFLAKNPSVGVEINSAEPSLIIREIGGELELSFDMKFDEEGLIVEKETETRYKAVSITADHIDIALALKSGKLRVPEKGRDKLVRAIRSLSTKISIQSDLEEHFENLPAVEPDERIHALITPVHEGFHLEFFIKPFETVPPYFKPGKGSEAVIADLEGVRTRTKRELKKERATLNEVEKDCPFLASFESPNYDWELTDTEACLKALTELEIPRNDGKLVIEWPKGQKLKLLGNVGFENLSLRVKGKHEWFEIEGDVRVSDDLVLSMKELNRLLTNEDTNFVELSDGQFIAITERLRRHLQSLNTALDDKNRLHPLRSGVLEEFAGELENFKTDKRWKAHLERMENARRFVPRLPETFDAELRPYQLEGYEWLSRLAEWGVGACLADDMGLGKTVMALALLVERAEKGAALVVAPVSVCRNWINEARKFAPTLNFQLFGDGDRKEAVEKLGKYDVLVTSYSLLQSEEKLFLEREFATIVLDEAQAVKNRQTKRSKTVMNLKGDFRLITTGTPIENHLGELWNLFNFINPGLLGGHEFFNRQFAVPIERENDENTRRTLQKLIRPFVLRRRKNEVLDDLPEKTEITLTVEMSPEERAFYEAVRRDALERIEQEGGEAKDKRFRILAELTRLRLACCHPKLVNEKIPLKSSKLELFGETLDELLENRHKALVFSQFVKHLRIVEEYLKERGVSYHYLDGSTPAKVRQERIDAFQRGSGDVFLISLKAGGTGLNLTAADYVIHLDPWWNPAVEDQATDRVHRIGQTRPVTVYRLLTEDTVEEKILRLHETKRDLADSLLAGTDQSGKLSAEDLLALIEEI